MSPQRRQQMAGYAAALVSGAAAGLLYAVNKKLMHTLSPLQVSWLEACIGFMVLLPGYWLRFRRDPLPRGTPWGWLVVFGLTAVVLFYFRTLGVALTSPTTTALIVRLEIVLVIVYSYLFLSERLAPLAWLGAALLIAGMLAAMDVSAQELVLRIGGLGALLIAAVGIASNSIVIKLHLGRVRNELTSLANAGIQTVAFAVLLLATGQFAALPRLLAEPHLLVLTLIGGLFIPLMLVPYYYAMKRIPMWSCRLLGLVTPVAAIMADFFWLHAPVTAGQLIGLALVTGGAALVIMSGATPAPPRPL